MGWPNFCSFLISSIFKSSSLPLEAQQSMAFVSDPTLLSVFLFTCYFSGCYGEVLFPGQLVQNVLQCFNAQFIYVGCTEAYRLNPSGHVNVLPNDARLFCNGPCLEETQLVLDCVDGMMANYLFRNGACVQNIRDALKATCSYANQQGNFIGGSLWEGERSRADVLLKRNILYPFMPFGWFLFLI